MASMFAGCGDNGGGAANTPSCTEDATCDDHEPCNGTERCTGGECAPGTAPADGTDCGSGMVCQAGGCVAVEPPGPRCGDGHTDADLGEECDDGNAVDNDGCDKSCKYSCVADDETRNCASSDSCTQSGTCDDTTHICFPGVASEDNTDCMIESDAGYCSLGKCRLPMCGNALTEKGEDCDGGEGCKQDCTFVCSTDPATQCADAGLGTPTFCQKLGCTPQHTCAIVTATENSGLGCDANDASKICVAGACGQGGGCGDGTRQATEECDDGDRANLDGCDSTCRLEQDARINSLVQQFTTDAFCTKNALGAAILGDTQIVIQGTWDLPVHDGRLTIAFKFLNVSGPLGPLTTTDFSLGFVHATPVKTDAYDGGSDLDWWYVRDPASVDANEVPLVKLDGHLEQGHLTAGPGELDLKLLFALQPATVHLFNSRVEAQIDDSLAAPMLSTDGSTPGHLASERLDPAIQTFTVSNQGAMCAEVSAKSLAETLMPNLLQVVCTKGPNNVPAFVPTNHLLDAFIAGCNIFGTPGVAATQPDGSIDGATYHFAVDPQTLAVASCTKDGAPAELDDCMAKATYSSYFKFESDRVIIHRN